MSNFIVEQNHPLIKREQTYVLDRKLLTVHSNDRDISKWPNSNHFEIELPQHFSNVQSIRLLNISLPNNHYVFMDSYQNTKLKFTVKNGIDQAFMITISEGTYTGSALAAEIETKMNRAVSDGVAGGAAAGYNKFRCRYNEVSNTFWFGNEGDDFQLNFDEKIDYGKLCNQPKMWNNYSRWGLPAYLGYKKKTYESTLTPENSWFSPAVPGAPFGFAHEMQDGPGNEWLTDATSNNWIVNVDQFPKHLNDENSICNVDLQGDVEVYMELDKYNSMDELQPYVDNSSGWFNNNYSGKVKNAFAKIPLTHTNDIYDRRVVDSTRNYIANISHYEPPLERIQKLKFKFRFHDGRYVNFKCIPFNFTLEFNMLRDEQMRARIVRVPPLYCL